VVIKARFIGGRLNFFDLFTYSPEKGHKKIDLFLITYKHFELLSCFVTKNFSATFIIDHPRCHLKLWPIFVLRAVLNVL
jgi:hypothetical protein